MDLTDLFCNVDDFVKNQPRKQQVKIGNQVQQSRNKRTLDESEVMTICIAFHQSGYKNFKGFYREYVCKFLLAYFPNLVSYNRFVELQSTVIHLLTDYLVSKFDSATGISYIDSTPIQVCKPKRMKRNKTFKHVAKKGRSTIGWFFGFKLHLIINEKGGLIAVRLTPGNTDDRNPVFEMAKDIFGKLFGDKGYISKALAESLLENGVQLITSVKKNMKNKLMSLMDKILLRKRSIIETVNDQLKNISQVEHSRHRSLKNFIVNLLCGLIAYTQQQKKPSITGVTNTMLAIA
jgi:hypothetical protein